MAITQEEIKKTLLKAFPDATLELKDLVGDGDHFELKIADASFKGLTPIAQHKLVYKALGSVVGNELHALSLKTSAK